MFDVGETVTLDARGESLTIIDPNGVETQYTQFPGTILANVPGRYRTTQTLISGETSVNEFFVKVAASESDVTRTVEELPNPVFPAIPPDNDLDLLLYLAIALTALLFIEWLLQAKENM